jgi:glycosyltransferase involved in cell wall biosynthesis
LKVPRVSIGMPVWNSNPEYFEAALSDVLAQDFQDFEIILSDNGSDEVSRSMYEAATKRDPRIRLHRHDTNRGGSWNMRFVLDQAQGDYFMWAADDDRRSPTFLGRLVDALDRNPECVTAAPLAGIIDEHDTRTKSAGMDMRYVTSSSPAVRLLCLIATRHENIDLYGLHRRRTLQDLDMTIPSVWLDMHMTTDILLHGPIARVEEELFSYRISSLQEESYARRLHQVLGDAAKPEADKPKPANAYLGANYGNAAFSFLSYVLRSRARLSSVQRAECFLTLATILIVQGWFTRDEFVRLVPDLKRAIDDRQIGPALRLGFRLAVMSPSFPFVLGAHRLSKMLGRA